jgi:16S rRNA (uracil1498-N3)-methyltransferase
MGGMNTRFYAPDASAPGDIVELPEDETQHMMRVLRLRAGDAVRVFNGRGGEFDALVEEVAKATARVRVGNQREPAPEPSVAVTLAQAVLKGDKMDDVVRDAVMMGVSAVQPIVTTRSEVTPAAIERGRRRERWERIAVSSAKQCGRAVVPAVLAPLGFQELLTACADMRLPNPVLMLVEPRTDAEAVPLREMDETSPREATVVVGPEGGWTDEEMQRGADAARLVTLGGRTLRADAMAVVALAALFTKWRDF